MSAADLSQCAAVLGAQWGDEGKGKIVDALAGEFDICARFNGGSNAGHTIKANGQTFAFHLMPSAIINPKAECFIGAGVVVHVPTLLKELAQLDAKGVEWKGRFFIAERAHLVFNFHQTIDGLQEGALPVGQKIGTTQKGIGPSYMEKKNRSNLRMVDLREMLTPHGFEAFKQRMQLCVDSAHRRFNFEYDMDSELVVLNQAAQLFLEAGCFVDGVTYINRAYESGKKILMEGANAAMLDIDFGTYPFVTSSNTTVGACATGTGLAIRKIGDVIGVVKAYMTRVGEGPFPTELLEGDKNGDAMRSIGREFGTTTGRPRRCGWLDIPLLHFTHRLNAYSHINLTKLDILSDFEEILICTQYKLDGEVIDRMPASLNDLARVEVEYETLEGWKSDISSVTKWDDLPPKCQAYVNRIEELLGGVHIRWIGTGPGRDCIVEKPAMN